MELTKLIPEKFINLVKNKNLYVPKINKSALFKQFLKSFSEFSNEFLLISEEKLKNDLLELSKIKIEKSDFEAVNYNLSSIDSKIALEILNGLYYNNYFIQYYIMNEYKYYLKINFSKKQIERIEWLLSLFMEIQKEILIICKFKNLNNFFETRDSAGKNAVSLIKTYLNLIK